MANSININATLEALKIYYPDATLTTIKCETKFCFNDQLNALVRLLCVMTHTAVLTVIIKGNTLFIFKSAAFLKVVKQFKKGLKVKYYNPIYDHPGKPSVIGEIVSDKIYTDKGVSYVNVEFDDPVQNRTLGGGPDFPAMWCKPLTEEKGEE